MTTLTKKDVKIHKFNKMKTEPSSNLNWEQIKTKILDLNIILKKEKSLSPKNRQSLTIMGKERRAFTQQSLITALVHPNLIPHASSAEELQDLLENEEVMLGVLSEIEILKRHIYDYYYELSHEEYQNALKIYRRSKMGATENENEMPAIYQRLKKLYLSSSKTKTNTLKTSDFNEAF